MTTPEATAAADVVPEEPSGPRAAPARAWRAALEHLERLLLAGELGPGDHLPPERRLAADLGVSRSSVREAIRVLDALGLVRTATGSGPTSGAVIVASPTGGMSAVMRLQVAARGFPIADVVEARLVIEPAIAAHLARGFAAAAHATGNGATGAGSAAAGQDAPPVGDAVRHVAAEAPPPARRTGSPARGTRGETDVVPPGWGQASALLDAMEVSDLTPAEFLALDARFHVALAEASGNTVLSAIMAGLRDSIEGYVLAAVPNLPSWADTVARLRVEHREIVTAIERGEPADAARRVHAHITGYYRHVRPEESELAHSPEPIAPGERRGREHAESHITPEPPRAPDPPIALTHAEPSAEPYHSC
jgi:GntR family transcriptional repressor for pyruvate dehydrogenase complex